MNLSFDPLHRAAMRKRFPSQWLGNLFSSAVKFCRSAQRSRRPRPRQEGTALWPHCAWCRPSATASHRGRPPCPRYARSCCGRPHSRSMTKPSNQFTTTRKRWVSKLAVLKSFTPFHPAMTAISTTKITRQKNVIKRLPLRSSSVLSAMPCFCASSRYASG